MKKRITGKKSRDKDANLGKNSGEIVSDNSGDFETMKKLPKKKSNKREKITVDYTNPHDPNNEPLGRKRKAPK